MSEAQTEQGMACEDCLMPIAYGDFTGLDYHHEPGKADERMREIMAGIRKLSAKGSLLINTDLVHEFSRETCDCCGSQLHGKRYGIEVIL